MRFPILISAAFFSLAGIVAALDPPDGGAVSADSMEPTAIALEDAAPETQIPGERLPEEAGRDTISDPAELAAGLRAIIGRLDAMESALRSRKDEPTHELESLFAAMHSELQEDFWALLEQVSSLPDSEWFLAQLAKQEETTSLLLLEAMTEHTPGREGGGEIWLRFAGLAATASFFVGCAVLVLFWRLRFAKVPPDAGPADFSAFERSLTQLVTKVEALEGSGKDPATGREAPAQAASADAVKALLESAVSGAGERLTQLEEKMGRLLEGMNEMKEAQDKPLDVASNATDEGTTDLPEPMIQLLPAPLRNDGELAAWRPFLMTQCTQNPAAADFLAHLLSFQASLSDKKSGPSQFAGVLYQLSEKAYAWWETLDWTSVPQSLMPQETGVSTAPTLGEVNAQWLGALKTVFKHRWSDLEVSAYYPDNRFDPDVMVRDEENSGVRPTLSRPLSWAILQCGGDKPRILHRAKVVTH